MHAQSILLSLLAVLGLSTSLLTTRTWARDWALPPGVSPGYLIVAPQQLLTTDAFDEFVSFKRGLGFKVRGVAVETVGATMPGRDLPEKLREYLKRVHGAGSSVPINHVRYVLLVGGHDTIPYRAVWARWVSAEEPSGISYTDWYYADLTGDWDSNTNGLFGQGLLLDHPVDAADLHYEVAVGRIPFTNHIGVQTTLNRIIAAESDGGAWKGRALSMGAFMELARQEWDTNNPPQYVNRGTDTDNAVLMELIWQETLQPLGFSLTRVYETTPNPNGVPPSAYAADYDLGSAATAWFAEGGYGLVNLAGHGNSAGVYRLFWKADLNTNQVPDQPTAPIDTGDGQTISRNEISGSASYVGVGGLRGLHLRTGVAPVVAVAGCTTAQYNDSNNLGASFLALGKASAYVGSLATTGYEPGWVTNTGTGVMEDVMLRFNRVLLDSCPRVGDAVYTTRMQLFDETVGEPRGRALIRDVLLGDPSMSYWGNAAAFAGPWPMFRHDIRNTGFTTNSGPLNGVRAWNYPIAPVALGKAIPSPIVGADGTIYVGSDNGRLHAVHPDGQPKWQFDAGGAIGSGPILTISGTLYFRAEDGYLYAVSAHGVLLWRVPVARLPGQAGPTPLHAPFSNCPRVSPDGTVYALSARVGGSFFAGYRPTGQAWMMYEIANGGAAGTPAVAPDGTLYVVSWDGVLRAYDPPEDEQGTYGLLNAALGSPALGANGNVYVGDTRGRLHAVGPDLAGLWHFDLPHGTNQINSSPAIGEDGSIYFGAQDHRVYALESTGELRWQFNTGGPVDSSPALDPAAVYVVGGANSNASVFALDRATGAPRWVVPIGGNALAGSSPAIGSDRSVYVASSVGQLIRIHENAQEPAPNDVQATNITPKAALITWRNNGRNDARFSLERRIASSNNFLTIDLGTNQASYLDNGLEANALYTYRLRAVSPYPSPYSEELRFRTPRLPPVRPTNVMVSADSAYGIRLHWSRVDSNALAVAIYRAPTATGPYVQVGLALADVTTYLDRNPEAEMNPQPVGGDPRPGQTYHYTLRAFNNEGESSATAPIPAATRGLNLLAPAALAVQVLSATKVRITWQNQSTGTTGYVLERACDENATFEVVATLPASTTSFEEFVYADPEWCRYRVRAINATADSPFVVSQSVFIPGRLVPARLTLPFLQNDGHFGFRISGDSGMRCTVEGSPDLQNWLPLGTVTLTNNVYDFRDTNAPASVQRFYRVVSEP